MGERAVAATTPEILAVLAAHAEIAAINRAAIDEARLADRSITIERRLPSRAMMRA